MLETATVRMLLRYKLSTEPKVGEWCDQKEPVSLLTSLQPVKLFKRYAKADLVSDVVFANTFAQCASPVTNGTALLA